MDNSADEFGKIFPSKTALHILIGFGFIFFFANLFFGNHSAVFLIFCGLCWGAGNGVRYIISRIDKYKEHNPLPPKYAGPARSTPADELREEEFEKTLPTLLDVITWTAIGLIIGAYDGWKSDTAIFAFTIFCSIGLAQLFIWTRVYLFKKKHNLSAAARKEIAGGY